MSQSYTRGTPIDTDPTLAANSDLVAPSQAAVVAYVTNAVGAGGVVSVTATPPVVSTGGINPTISMLQATGLQDGYLTSTDWNTFNNKVSTIGVIDSVVKSANGAVVSGSSIFMQTADGTFPGLVSTGVQTFAGAKTFSSAPTFSTMTAGSVLFAGASGLLSQDNANLFWDDANNRLGIRTASPNSSLHVSGSTTASGAIARGINFTPTLVAAANNDILVGLDLTPTFTNAPYTGVQNYALRITGRYFQDAGSSIPIIVKTSNYDVAQYFGSTDYAGFRVIGRSSGNGTPYVGLNTSSTIATNGIGTQRSFFAYWGESNNFSSIGSGNSTHVIAFSNATSNVVIQNGGAFTDAGFRLDVNGTFRSQGDITISDTRNIILATGTGTKIGTATTQKLAFFNSTPIVQPANTIAINDVLVNLGLRASGGVSNFTTNIDISTKDIVTDGTTGTKIGTATSQKLGFWNAIPQSQPPSGTTINGVLDALGLRASGGIANFSADIDISKYNIITDNTVGTKVATDPGQWLSFWNAAPGPQPDLSVPSASFSSTGGTTITDTDTFDGYTIAQVVAALRQVGLLA